MDALAARVYILVFTIHHMSCCFNLLVTTKLPFTCIGQCDNCRTVRRKRATQLPLTHINNVHTRDGGVGEEDVSFVRDSVDLVLDHFAVGVGHLNAVVELIAAACLQQARSVTVSRMAHNRVVSNPTGTVSTQ